MDWWFRVQADIRSDEYGITWQEESPLPDRQGAYQAPNRAQGFRTWFTEKGITVVPRREDVPSWTWGLTLLMPGEQTDTQPGIQVYDNRIELDRGRITEWYVNTPDGLEQGFTIHRPPVDRSQQPAVSRGKNIESKIQNTGLYLDLLLSGSLHPKFAEDGHAVDFWDSGNVSVLRYAKLKVTDATGQELPAHFEGWVGSPVTGLRSTDYGRGGGIRIVIDAEGAVYPITVDPLATSPAWTAEGDQDAATFGYRLGTAGDVNGDGYSDVIVGSPYYDNGQTDEGRVYFYLGSASGLSMIPSWTMEGDQDNARFGSTVGTAGDVNGDGYSDVIVGAPLYDNDQTDEGRAYVFLGSASGLSTIPSWTMEGDQDSAEFGFAVGTAGDVNGDGYSDVIVGAPNYTNDQSYEGRAYVYLGSASELSVTAAWTVEGDQDAAFFGRSVATAGDIDGDGYSDVIVGAPYYDNGQYDEGRVYVYLGLASGLSTTASWTVESDQDAANFGFAVGTAGDVNGDGYSDVIVGAPYYDNGQGNEGQAFIFLGSASGLSTTAAWTAEGNQVNAYFGQSVATAGDVNGDGYSDVTVGAPLYDNGQNNEGRAFVYLGSASGLSATAVWIEEVDQVSAFFGIFVGTAGDVNGDGYSDIIVGASGYDNGQTDEGRAYVYMGSASGLAAATSWTGESNAEGARYGEAVRTAGDVNGDGFDDVLIGAPFYSGAFTEEGAVFLYLGGPDGVSVVANWSLTGEQDYAHFGFSVGGAGDVNGDGYSDLIIGAPDMTQGFGREGGAFVYLGGAMGPSASADWSVFGGQGTALLGEAVAGAGDVNGDGYGDVIVGVRRYDNGETDEGRAMVFLGSSAGLAGTPVWTAEGEQNNAYFGNAVATAGDVNRDGYSDIIIGARGYDDLPAFQPNEGRAFLYLGSAAGPSAMPAWTAEGDQNNAYLGHAVATAGDVNGDGYSDVIVGSPFFDGTYPDAGLAAVYLGGSIGLSSAPAWTVEGSEAGQLLGWSTAPAGDVNRDGFSDVIIGIASYSNGETEEGGAAVYIGSASGLLSSPDWTMESDQESASFWGTFVGPAGDVNGDGFADVLVGISSYDNGETDEGRAWVYLGGGGPGISLCPIQRRIDNSAMIAPLGRAGDGLFRLALSGRTPFGRSDVKLEWQVTPLGGTFSSGLNPFQTEYGWTNSQLTGTALSPSLILQTDGPYLWRMRTKYRAATTPLQGHGPWFSPTANGLMETDLRRAPTCNVPDEAAWIYEETKSVPDNYPIIHWQDWNQLDQRTGWNVRRSNDPALPKESWEIVASNILDGDAATSNNQWTDISGDIPGGPYNTWYYQVTAYNANCPAEGPF